MTSRGQSTVTLAALVLALTVPALSAGAGASPSWLPGRTLSATGWSADQPRVALDAAGNTIALWRRYDGQYSVLESAVRPAAGAWARPEALPAGDRASESQIALTPGGEALAVWSNRSAGFNVVQAAVRPVGGAWSSPQNLSLPGGVNQVQMALNPAGDAVVVWAGSSGSHSVVKAAVRPARRAWRSAETLSAPDQPALEPDVALDPAGNAVAVWIEWTGSRWIPQAAVRPIGGPWRAPEDLSASDAEAPQVALDPAGNAIAVWLSVGGPVQAAVRPPGGPWSAPELVSAADAYVYRAQVAFDSSGNAIAIWASNDGIEAAVRPAAGRWGEPQILSGGGLAGDPHVAFDSAGDAVAVWYRGINSHATVEAAERPAGGSWSGPQQLSGSDGEAPQIALDPRGDAVAVWQLGVNTKVVQAAVRDAFPVCVVPNLVGHAIPRAKTQLAQTYCLLGKVSRAYSRTVRSGRVISQRPRARERLASGAKVNVVVSRGRRPLHR